MELLPEPLQAMTPEERVNVVRANSEERNELKRKIQKLSRQRADYIAAEVEAIDDKESSLDYRIFETVRDQAGKKGLEYSDSPTY